MIMEDDRSQDFKGEEVGRSPRGADGLVSVWRLAGLRARKSWCFSSSLKAGKPMSQFKGSHAEGNSLLLGRVILFVLCRPSTDRMRSTHIREDNLLTQSTDFKVNLIQNLLTKTPRIIFDPISLYLVVRSSWYITLTITFTQLTFAVSTRNIHLYAAVSLWGGFPQYPQGCQWTMERAHWSTLFLRALKLGTRNIMSLRNFSTTWLLLTGASGTIQNRGSLPWVHVIISWGALKNAAAAVPLPLTLVWEGFGTRDF